MNHQLQELREKEDHKLYTNKWKFLNDDWVVLKHTKYHRSEVREVREIKLIKDTLLKHLGMIPVFFFMNVLFGCTHYPCPYRSIEKGLLILYQLVDRLSINEMERFIPRSSYQVIYNMFYISEMQDLNKLTFYLQTMFSTPELRLLAAKMQNPHGFKHVTLMLDGYDSRALHNGAYKPGLYSYKLKKSGYHIQVCIDVIGMVLLVSSTVDCRDTPDSRMIKNMGLLKRISPIDCIGGHSQSLN
ncbi:hypothetical protein DL89DRAFT_256869 [Linderina pennispora]|uniref:DDE Tnp4 domain-containing protein n=1 Tax=Linderina pennispora TaxID=61395 RepID=A0A1Y1WB61_9FUNG|nr:uncharacterized protein DL89DRAFT_256869 [Linderina pennispora]ORX70682.1 hypothetical protein DL89DRAFT_256869 [Linderina pennispora]